MTADPVPVAVVGVGNMGINHVRVYDELPGAELVEVVESDPDRACDVREQYDVPVYDDLSELTDAEAATIAVPNDEHRDAAVTCLENGLDVLVEKPLATSPAEARAIVDAADERDAILQVGHIERFNPAVQMLEEILSDQELIAVETHRLGPYNDHLSDESVVFDLMIHDLDIIDMVSPGSLTEFNVLGSSPRSDAVDHAIAQLKYDSEVLASATASHVTHGKIRTLSATTKETYLELDYQQQDISVQRRGTEERTELLGQSGYRTEVVSETPYVRTREPLKNELEHFLECVVDRTRPDVDGELGVRAVELAERAVEQILR